MKILSAIVKNFGSYTNQTIDFEKDRGLYLVSGPMGSGKSTLCDIVPWVLFGKTTKNGLADEVRMWGTKNTIGEVRLQVNGAEMIITRTRAPNDLYFSINKSDLVRGKDLSDTQKLMNEKLGITEDSYFAGAYLHELSSVLGFFTAQAKTRRQIIEELVDLSFAQTLADKITERKSILKIELKELEKTLAELNTKMKSGKDFISILEARSKAWIESSKKALKDTRKKSETFESERFNCCEAMWEFYFRDMQDLKDEIESLENQIQDKKEILNKLSKIKLQLCEIEGEKCPTCGAPKKNEQKFLLIKEKQKLEDSMLRQDQLRVNITQKQKVLDGYENRTNARARTIEEEMKRKNPYNEEILKLESARNPYQDDIRSYLEKDVQFKSEIEEVQELDAYNKQELSDLEVLGEVISVYRIKAVEDTVRQLEFKTNDYLTTYFDAELRVTLNLAETDKIETLLHKDGNECSFTQLSKGQRQLLKLCFGVSIMQVLKNQYGFNLGFMDEALDGLDENFKLKAYTLLEEVATHYDSLYIVEHNEALKNLFLNRYDVTIINGVSHLEKN